MTENTSEKSNVLSDATVRNLREARTRMLRLHKILLDVERADFERESGPLTSGALLQLVINHEQFAWLRKLSAMVVQIDELLDARSYLFDSGNFNKKPFLVIELTHEVSNPVVVPRSIKLTMRLSMQSSPFRPLKPWPP